VVVWTYLFERRTRGSSVSAEVCSTRYYYIDARWHDSYHIHILLHAITHVAEPSPIDPFQHTALNSVFRARQ
jgi:hypothetical protein